MAPYEHRLELKVYLEDTDAQGIVYHANYLKYCERARTEILLEAGHRLDELGSRGWTFVVHEMHIKFARPARVHDLLEVRTGAERASAYRLEFRQAVHARADGAPLCTADVQVVCVDETGRLRELPPGLFAPH